MASAVSGASAVPASLPACDVAIIGAGWAGLNTARHLLRAHPLLRVTLVEARERVGGRSCSVQLPAGRTALDVGGGWVGPTETRVLELVHEMGLELREQVWPTNHGALQHAGGPPILSEVPLTSHHSTLKGIGRQTQHCVMRIDRCVALQRWTPPIAPSMKPPAPSWSGCRIWCRPTRRGLPRAQPNGLTRSLTHRFVRYSLASRNDGVCGTCQGCIEYG
jgi:phytoene dehydrogenase-like protein